MRMPPAPQSRAKLMQRRMVGASSVSSAVEGLSPMKAMMPPAPTSRPARVDSGRDDPRISKRLGSLDLTSLTSPTSQT